MKKSIIHVIDSLEMGGAEKLITGYIKDLIEYDHVIVTLLPENDFSSISKNISIVCLNHKSKIQIASSVLKLRKVIKKHNPSIIHTHLYWSTIIGRMAAIGVKARFIFSLHTVMSMDSYAQSRWMTWLEKLTYTKEQTVIGVSATVLNDYERCIGIKGNRHVLYNYIDDSFFQSKKKTFNLESETIKIVAVGNIKPVKNYEYLIEVFKIVDNSKFSLDIYGDGNQIELLKKNVTELNLNINFKGVSTEINRILPQYDLYVIPSLFEGFGIAPLEAMAIGLPVLLSNIEVFKEIASNEALFFDPKNVNELVAILNRIKKGEIELNQYSKKCQARANLISRKSKYLEQLNTIYSD